MHSFNSCLMHCVFSTTERRPWLTLAIRERLWPYLGGIVALTVQEILDEHIAKKLA